MPTSTSSNLLTVSAPGPEHVQVHVLADAILPQSDSRQLSHSLSTRSLAIPSDVNLELLAMWLLISPTPDILCRVHGLTTHATFSEHVFNRKLLLFAHVTYFNTNYITIAVTINTFSCKHMAAPHSPKYLILHVPTTLLTLILIRMQHPLNLLNNLKPC